jgi:hypothetical protein
MDLEPVESSLFTPNYKKIVDILFRRPTKMVSAPMDIYRTLYHIRGDLFSLEQEFMQASETDKLNFRIKVRLMPAEPPPVTVHTTVPTAVPTTVPASAAVPQTQDIVHILIVSGYWNKGFHATTVERETSVQGVEQKRITIANF